MQRDVYSAASDLEPVEMLPGLRTFLSPDEEVSMCQTKDEAKTKIDKVSASLDRLSELLERVLQEPSQAKRLSRRFKKA